MRKAARIAPMAIVLGVMAACRATGAIESAPATQPAVTAPPPMDLGSLTYPAELTAGVDQVTQEVNTDLSAGAVSDAAKILQCDPTDLADWYQGVRADGGSVHLALTPLFPLASGMRVLANLAATSADGGTNLYWGNEPADVGRRVGGGWEVALAPTSQPDHWPSLLREDAQVAIDPAAGWLTGDATLTIAPNGSDYLPLALAVQTDSAPGLRIVKVSSGGDPAAASCAFRVVEGYVVVPSSCGANGSSTVQVRIQYAGDAPVSTLDRVTSSDLVLRSQDYPWLPGLAGSLVDWSVTVAVPQGFAVYGQGMASTASPASQTSGTPPGYVATRFTVSSSAGFTLYGGARFVTRTFVLGATQVTVALWPVDEGMLDGFTDDVRRALQAVTTLGPYPLPEVNVVETGFGQGEAGYGALGNITVGNRMVEAPDDGGDRGGRRVRVQFVGHEAAHAFFPGVVPSAGSEWPESVAEYVGSWALSADEAGLQRSEWAQGYAGLPPDEDEPLATLTADVSDWERTRAIAYCKGALLFSALEHLVGREAVADALRALIHERAGKPTGWEDLIAAFDSTAHAQAGGAVSEWLRPLVERASAPDPWLADAIATSGGVTGHLLQTAPPFLGPIDLGFFHGDQSLGRTSIDLQGLTTPFSVEAPSGTDRIVVDPGHWFPLRPPPAGDSTALNVAVPAPASP
jgi:hypothetical protein